MKISESTDFQILDFAMDVLVHIWIKIVFGRHFLLSAATPRLLVPRGLWGIRFHQGRGCVIHTARCQLPALSNV